MLSETTCGPIAVFDIGGTWFRWGLFDPPSRALCECQRVAAINYLSHPALDAAGLQRALMDFIVGRVRQMLRSGEHALRAASIALGAPINAHDGMVLGSGPLWGDAAQPIDLLAHLREAVPEIEWHLLNDITALLSLYMEGAGVYRKTMLVTVSSGVGSRLYDHRARRIPYDPQHGIQGEIGHLVSSFELAGERLNERCECGGWNHLNAFCSGRGMASLLRRLPALGSVYAAVFSESPDHWQQASDAQRLDAFKSQLDRGNEVAEELLDAFVTPLARLFAAALSFDPEIDRIVMTGGVVRGFDPYYKQTLQRRLMHEGLYQITERDPHYVTRRLLWDDTDDFAGLRGAGLYAGVSHGQ